MLPNLHLKKKLPINLEYSLNYLLLFQDLLGLNNLHYLLSTNHSKTNLNKLFEFNDEIKIENISDQFELDKYQDEIIKNFIDLKINEFILKISTL